jgi:alpha-galactosidase
MPKIVIIGAGSRNFAKNIITDVILYPELRDSTIALVDIDQARLDLTADFAKAIVKQHGFNTKVESTMNRREALKGADYVITTIAIGKGRLDGEKITGNYGLPWDDTVGPCGVFEANRLIPVILDIAHDMEKICPDAWLLNYSNPMAMICWAVNDYTNIKNVGLCPNPYSHASKLADYAGVPIKDVTYWAAGVNHFSWYLDFRWKDKDIYPLLREKFNDPNNYMKPSEMGSGIGKDLMEVEMLHRFGYFTSAGQHLSMFLPYFRRKPILIEKYNLDNFDLVWPPAPKRISDDAEEMREQLSSGYKFPLVKQYRWSKHATDVIHSLETGMLRRIDGNVKNNGLITNLLEGCCVEVPCFVDKCGVHPCYVGDLPEQCATLIRSNIGEQELAVRGIVEKDKTKILQSLLVDPLTSSVLTIDEIVDMVNEMFQVDKPFLKGFK